MDIGTLRLLLAIGQRQSFAAVARSHDLDPSSVSRTVAQAEHELGFRLFHRTTRQLALTEQGEMFIRRIAAVVDEFDRVVDQGRGTQTDISGTVRVTTSVAFGNACLMPLIGRFRDAFPLLRLDLVLSDERLDLVEDRIDLGLRLGPEVGGDLICSKLRSTRYRVCATPSYLGKAPPLKRPADLSNHRCLLFSLEPFRTRWLFKNTKGQVREVAVNGDIVASNAVALRTATLDSHGPALLADWLIGDDLTDGRLVDVFPKHEVAATTFDTAVWLVYPSKAFLPVRVRETINFLREHI